MPKLRRALTISNVIDALRTVQDNPDEIDRQIAMEYLRGQRLPIAPFAIAVAMRRLRDRARA